MSAREDIAEQQPARAEPRSAVLERGAGAPPPGGWRRPVWRLGRALASPATFGVLLLLFTGGVYHFCRYTNVLSDYPDGDGFPYLAAMTGEWPGGERTAQLRQLPLPSSSRYYGGGNYTHMLPTNSVYVGVFASTFVQPTVRPAGRNRIRVTLHNYGASGHIPWDVARYEATPTTIIPLYINGGSAAASVPASAVVAALLAAVVRLFGKGLGRLALARGVAPLLDGLRGARWFDDPFLVPLLAPFLYYAWLIAYRLLPYNTADAYAYLWRRSFNAYYLAGRSLTQRLLYTLCGSNLRVISLVQLLGFALCATALYALLRRRQGLLVRALLVLFLVFIFSSYTLNISAIVVAAEPVFLALVLVFPLALFACPPPAWPGLVLACGAAFALSKNVAPYAVLWLLALHLLLVRGAAPRGRALVFAALAALSVASMVVTRRFDASVEMNTLNNICSRVLVNPVTTRLFQEKYGMPEGDYVRQLARVGCNGRLDGRPVYRVDPATMNFELIPDRYGLIAWVREHGQSAFVHYAFLDDPLDTFVEVAAGFHALCDGDGILYMGRDLGPPEWIQRSLPTNLERLTALDPRRERGFFGFDALQLLQRGLIRLGFDRVGVILACAAFGMLLLLLFRSLAFMALPVAWLLGALGMFALTYLGDGGANDRHTLPAFVMLDVAGVLYLAALARAAGCAVRHLAAGRAKRHSPEMSAGA